MNLRSQLSTPRIVTCILLVLPGSVATNVSGKKCGPPDKIAVDDNFCPSSFKNRYPVLNFHGPAFIISIPFYRELWFQASFTVFVITSALLYIKYRLRNIKKRNENLSATINSHKELREALEALRISENKLRSHTHMQDRLIAAMAHDIKNPLKYIAIAAKYVLQNIEKEDKMNLARSIKILYNASQRVYLLTENLLEYIKLHSRNSEITYEKLNLYDLMEEKIEIFRDIASGQSTQIIMDIPFVFYVNTDPKLLSIIVHNLLDNAIKVTNQGSVKISALKMENGFEIDVEDTGPGMPAYIIKWCNESHPESNGAIIGHTGLGLSIVKELMAWINGQVSIRNKETGAVVRLIFPSEKL